MIALARFIMRGPSQAALVVTGAALLALILTPMAWISGGALALVALRLGMKDALLVMAYAALGASVIGWFALGSPAAPIGLALFLWAPALIAAQILRQTVSLSSAMQVVALLAVSGLGVMYLAVPDISSMWKGFLHETLQPMLSGSGQTLSKEDMDAALELMSRLIPGILASGLMISTLLSLLLGRWWQAALYNPGGLSEEFNNLRLGQRTAALALFALGAAALLKADFLLGVLMVTTSLYLFQGLALVHGLIAIRQVSKAWLIGVYGTLLVFPYSVILISTAGLVDAWADFRARQKKPENMA